MNQYMVIVSSIVVSLSIIISGFIYWVVASDPANPTQYPKIGNTKLLKDLSANTDDKYMLLRWNASMDLYDVIDDYDLLLNNKDVFAIRNKREAYFTTCETVFSLYKNGVKLAYEICDETGLLTEVEYGTLENNFKRKSRMEFESMLNNDISPQ